MNSFVHQVYFNSVCVGTSDPTEITPDDQLFISLHALPMYQTKTEDLSKLQILKIPGMFLCHYIFTYFSKAFLFLDLIQFKLEAK